MAMEGQSCLFCAQETRLKSSGTQCSFVAPRVGDDGASLAPNPPTPRQSKSRRPLTRVAHASKPLKIVREGRRSVAVSRCERGKKRQNGDKSDHRGGKGR